MTWWPQIAVVIVIGWRFSVNVVNYATRQDRNAAHKMGAVIRYLIQLIIQDCRT